MKPGPKWAPKFYKIGSEVFPEICAEIHLLGLFLQYEKFPSQFLYPLGKFSHPILESLFEVILSTFLPWFVCCA